MKTCLILSLLLFSSCAHASGPAHYLRLWRGFQLPAFTDAHFQGELPSFMRATTTLYGNALSNYLVALPPSGRPAFVPDETALLAFGVESEYQRIRQTPEGRRYGESHWELFDRTRSGSLVVAHTPKVPSALVANTAYDFGLGGIDWSKGHTTYFVGLKKPGQGDFFTRLAKHVSLVRDSFLAFGLRGYVVVATADYELAIMNWESDESMSKAFGSLFGQAVMKDGQEFLDNLQRNSAARFDGLRAEPGSFYSTY